ncbi:hypothetical protein GOP80_06050 [Planococcaceae bacterium Storch 2/2-2]|nr:hypothetical protein [Planococcaceae bacterium Storch 2/2-2]
MKLYIFNKKLDEKGNHEVHHVNCAHLPDSLNQKWLGHFLNCEEALDYAKRTYHRENFDGCYWCSPLCHDRT